MGTSRRDQRAAAVLVAVLASSGVVLMDQQPPDRGSQGPIRVGVDLVSTAVVVRDQRGQFLANLSERDFEVYEDGVPQTIVTFSLIHGGRLFSATPAGPASA